MPTFSDADRLRLATQLSTEVAALLAKRARAQRHHIACGVLLAGGERVCGLNLVSSLGPASVCAEQITLGGIFTSRREATAVLVVTMRALFEGPRPHEIVSPCGRCRELLVEYAPRAQVILPAATENECHFVPVAAMLPHPFYRRGRNGAGPEGSSLQTGRA